MNNSNNVVLADVLLQDKIQSLEKKMAKHLEASTNARRQGNHEDVKWHESREKELRRELEELTTSGLSIYNYSPSTSVNEYHDARYWNKMYKKAPYGCQRGNKRADPPAADNDVEPIPPADDVEPIIINLPDTNVEESLITDVVAADADADCSGIQSTDATNFVQSDIGECASELTSNATTNCTDGALTDDGAEPVKACSLEDNSSE